jgi:Protein of unknown function (DUF3631)
MAQISRKDRKRLRDLHARMCSDNSGERDAAWRKLDALLKRLGKSWNDLPELLHDETNASAPRTDPRDADQSAPNVGANITPADTVRYMLEEYVALDEHEYVAVALWIIHTHVFDKFMVTPRLLLTSPVRNCGKTTLLDVCNSLVARAEKMDSITAAAIYHLVHKERRTLLVDEADNLELSAKAVLRAVLNSGHRKGGSVVRFVGGQPRRFSTFVPVALASIGSLTLPLMSRSVRIHMVRHDGMRPLRRFDETATDDLDAVYRHIFLWAKSATFNLDPEMPAEVRGRQADNWRPLIAIADACCADWGALARDAAATFGRGYHDEDILVLLLRDILEVFDARGVDRLASRVLVEALNAMDDAPWSEWRGIHDERQPRRLSQGELAPALDALWHSASVGLAAFADEERCKR